MNAKKIIASLLLLAMLMTFCACEQKQQGAVHKIGVVVYDLQDEQVQAFREYLEGYIEPNFPDVTFLYSSGVNDADAEMEFLRSAIEQGVEGILAFNSYDLEAEVELCATNQVYYIRPSSTTAAEDFRKVADNPYFLGYFGPGEDVEYQAGFGMANYFAQNRTTDRYFVVTGGAGNGNVMHVQRTAGILDALQASYGVTFDRPSQELAASAGTTVLESGALKVTLFSGYVGIEQVGQQAIAAFQADPAGVVMGVIPLRAIAASLGNARLGIIDCYTASNGELFKSGKLSYLTGKYQSIIAPAFAALYNAMGGYGDAFRDNGQAFAISQGFWTSTGYEDFLEKYALSSGIVLNAYSYEDILEVCKAHNPAAGIKDLQQLAAAWDYDSAVQRRK